jgi:hypothetical protein
MKGGKQHSPHGGARMGEERLTGGIHPHPALSLKGKGRMLPFLYWVRFWVTGNWKALNR